MSSAVKNEEVTKLIMNFLEHNQGCSFTQEEIVRVLLPKLDVKGDYHVKYPLQCMVINGIVNGRIDKSRVVRVSYKNPNEQKGSDGTELIPKSELDKLAANFRSKEAELISAHAAMANVYKSQIEELRLEKSQERIVKVVIEQVKKKPREIIEVFHSVFEEVVMLAQAREHIFLYGPTGSGKTHIGAQLAKVLDLPFYFISGSRGLSESKLNGRQLPGGKNGAWEYVPSEFVKAFEEGGVFLMDEMDALDDNVLLILNTALSNGRFAVPDRRGKEYVVQHPDFICIAAANTLGMGADRQYSGRNKLDAATMDRFAVGKLIVDYDPQLEAQICPDDELRNRLVSFRKAIEANRLERAMSTRFLQKAYKMKSAGWTAERIEKAYFTGWREDEINKVISVVGKLKPSESSVMRISGDPIPLSTDGGSVELEISDPNFRERLKTIFETKGRALAVKSYREATGCSVKASIDVIFNLAKSEGWVEKSAVSK